MTSNNNSSSITHKYLALRMEMRISNPLDSEQKDKVKIYNFEGNKIVVEISN